MAVSDDGIDEALSISGADLKKAIAAGVIGQDQAQRLVAYLIGTPSAEAADDERLRLVTGFNDIFVAIGLGLFFGALVYILGKMGVWAAPVLAWGMAEIFTRRMRMALPSILLLAIYVFTAFLAMLALLPEKAGAVASVFSPWWQNREPWAVGLAALVAVAAAGLHWWRFHVPITVAAGVAALVAAIAALAAAALGSGVEHILSGLMLVCGLATFALAMAFDARDRQRRTQLADRAFWLHLLAAPLIIHPLMVILSGLAADGAISILLLFAAVAVIALAIDRRALLVSSLGYLGFTLSGLFERMAGQGAGADNGSGYGILAVGAVVLILSVAWKALRAVLVPLLPPSLQSRLPTARQ